MDIFCPYCSQQYTVDDSRAGQVVQCAVCSDEFTIPDIPDAPDINCPYCLQGIQISSISEEIIYCPKCNGQIVNYKKTKISNKNEKKVNIIPIVLAIFYGSIIIGILFGVVSCITSCNEHQREQRRLEAEYGSISGARMFCRQRIENMLKVPSTANIVFSSDYGSKGEYSFSGYVDAENYFGAKIRRNFRAVVVYNKGNYEMKFLIGI